MKKLKGILVLVLLLALLASPLAVFASNVTQARFYALIQVSNNGTAVTNEITTCNISTTNLINGGFLNSSANNCAIQSSAGTDLPFMPGVNDDPWTWCLWVPALGADSVKTDILYTANTTGGKLRYFPGSGGMTAVDSTSLELGDNFTVEQSGWWDTDYSINKNAVYKQGAFKTYISGTENITSAIGGNPCLSYTTNDYCTKAALVTAPAGDNITIEAWFYLDALSGNNEAVITCGDRSGGAFWTLKKNAANKLEFKVGNVGGGDFAAAWISTAAIVAGEWHFVTAVYDDTAATKTAVYVDGEAEAGNDTGTGTAINQPNTYMVTGASWAGAAYDYYFEGDIDEIRVSDSVRSLADHIASYNSGAGIPLTVDGDTISLWHFNEGTGNPADETGSNDLINTGATWVSASPIIGGEEAVVTATDVTSGEYTVTVNGTANYPVWATGDVLDFDGTNDVATGAIYGAENDFAVSGWFKLTDNFSAASPNDIYVVSNWKDNQDFFVVRLEADDGKLTFGTSQTGVLKTMLSSATSWLGGVWYHFLVISSATDGGFFYIDGNLVDDDATVAWGISNGESFWIGARTDETSEFEGVIMNVSTFTDNLTAPERSELYQGIVPADAIDYWYIDEGTGTALVSYGTGLNDGTADVGDWIISTYTTGKTGRLCDFTIQVADDRWGENIKGNGVPNNNTDWTYFQNMGNYWEYTTTSVNETQVQYIDWEYDTTFYDSSGFDNDATPTFRSAPSDPDVTAEFISFLPVSEAQAPAYVLEEGVDFIESVPVIVSEWDVEPPAGTFPLAGVIVAVSNATDTPPQLPLVIIAGFTIIALSLAISSIMRKYGSGTIFVKLLVIAAIMGVFVAIGNFGIDFWMIFVFAIIGVALSMASRHVSWQ